MKKLLDLNEILEGSSRESSDEAVAAVSEVALLVTAGRLAVVSCIFSTIDEAGRFFDERGNRKVR